MDRDLRHCTGGSDLFLITKKKKCKKKEKEMQEMQMITTTPKKKKCKKWLSEEALQIAEKRREAKGKEEKERYTHLNAAFQRIELCIQMGISVLFSFAFSFPSFLSYL